MTNWREKAREIYEMVYQWGKVGVIVDDSAHAYQDSIKELIREAQAQAWEEGWIGGSGVGKCKEQEDNPYLKEE